MEQYVSKTNDKFAKSVYTYLQKGTIRKDIDNLIKQITYESEDRLMITFATLGHRDTISKEWTEYYVSTLEKNGICSIIGEQDYIPDKYPKAIRNPSDQAKLFISHPKDMNNMPVVAPGYIASQKIIHTLQFMIYEGDSWAYDLLKKEKDIPKTWKEWVIEYENDKLNIKRRPMSITERILEVYEETHSVKSTVKKTGCSWNKIVKTLSSEGIIINKTHALILEMYRKNISPDNIAKEIGCSKRTVMAYIPRKRPVYNENQSENALRIKRSRAKKKK